MARIRSIKPEFFTSEQVAECSTNARLLFVGTWVFADDTGRQRLSYRSLKMQVFPGDNFTDTDIKTMFDELWRVGLVEVYEVDGLRYFRIKGWHHQRIDKAQKSKCPAPEDGLTVPYSDDAPRQFQEHSANDPITLPPDTIGVDRIGMEGIRTEPPKAPQGGPVVEESPEPAQEPEQPAAPKPRKTRGAAKPYSDAFERFWAAYPATGRASKATAFQAFEKALGVVDLETLVEAAAAYASCEFVRIRQAKHAATWLNGRCWEDDPEALKFNQTKLGLGFNAVVTESGKVLDNSNDPLGNERTMQRAIQKLRSGA